MRTAAVAASFLMAKWCGPIVGARGVTASGAHVSAQRVSTSFTTNGVAGLLGYRVAELLGNQASRHPDRGNPQPGLTSIPSSLIWYASAWREIFSRAAA